MRVPILIAALAALACNDSGSPSGQEVFVHELEPSTAAPVVHRAVLDGESPTTLDLSVVVIKDAAGTRLAKLSATVAESGGWTVKGGELGEPVNMGTIEAPMMEIPVLVTRTRSSGCTDQSATQMIRVKADGSVIVQ
jgi:hypothetical protein